MAAKLSLKNFGLHFSSLIKDGIINGSIINNRTTRDRLVLIHNSMEKMLLTNEVELEELTMQIFAAWITSDEYQDREDKLEADLETLISDVLVQDLDEEYDEQS